MTQTRDRSEDAHKTNKEVARDKSHGFSNKDIEKKHGVKFTKDSKNSSKWVHKEKINIR